MLILVLHIKSIKLVIRQNRRQIIPIKLQVSTCTAIPWNAEENIILGTDTNSTYVTFATKQKSTQSFIQLSINTKWTTGRKLLFLSDYHDYNVCHECSFFPFAHKCIILDNCTKTHNKQISNISCRMREN